MNNIVFALALTCGTIFTASSAPTAEDVEAIAQIVADDPAYSTSARREASRQVKLLPQHLHDSAAFELRAARIIALADNGHTVLFPAQWTSRYQRSPVRFGMFADGIFVIDAPPQKSHLVGRQVVRVNGYPWQKLRRSYSKYQGGTESFKNQFFVYFLETPALLKAAGLGNDSRKLRISFDHEEAVVDAVMAPLDGQSAIVGEPVLRHAAKLIRADPPLYLQSVEPFAFAEIPPEHIAYIRIDTFDSDILEPFLDTTLARLRAGGFRNIILDIRFNLGGDLTRGRSFAQLLPRLSRGGRVYAITSGRTFSAAISILGYLKQADPEKVTIVGEPIGDRLMFWAEGKMRELPGLGAKILVATERHDYRTGCRTSDCHLPIRQHPIAVRTLSPDIVTRLRFTDYQMGRDPALEAILSDIRARRIARLHKDSPP